MSRYAIYTYNAGVTEAEKSPGWWNKAHGEDQGNAEKSSGLWNDQTK